MICLPHSHVRTPLPHTDRLICCSSCNIQPHIPDSDVVPTCPPSTAQALQDKLPGSLPGVSPGHTIYALAGGEGATVREVLRHKSVEKVIMCDIDQVGGQAGLEPSGSAGLHDQVHADAWQMRPMLRQSSSSSSRGVWAGRGSGGSTPCSCICTIPQICAGWRIVRALELNNHFGYLVRTQQPKVDG